jgi:hypothetical protein
LGPSASLPSTLKSRSRCTSTWLPFVEGDLDLVVALFVVDLGLGDRTLAGVVESDECELVGTLHGSSR